MYFCCICLYLYCYLCICLVSYCSCIVSVLYLYCICTVFVLYLCCICAVFVLYLQCICISDTIEVKPSLPSQCWTVCHSLQNCCRGLNVHYLPPVDWSRSMTVATIFYILSLQCPPSNFFKSNFVPFQSQRNSIFYQEIS